MSPCMGWVQELIDFIALFELSFAKGFVSFLQRNVWLQAKDMLPSRHEK